MSKPTVTTVVPVYNGATTLARCLASLRHQSSALREILVLDDGSMDDSPRLIEEAASHDPRVTMIRHSRNMGIARTLNEGIALATGDVVLVLHQDCELLAPDWVDRGLAALRDRPHTCLAGRPSYPFEELNKVELAFGMLRDSFYAPPHAEEVLGFSEFKCDLLPAEALAVARFDESFRAAGEDHVLSVLLSQAGFTLVRRSDLPYAQRFGNASTVRAQLRKEIAYGQAMGGILMRTGLDLPRNSAGSVSTARKLASRMATLVFAAGAVAMVLLALLGGNPYLVLLPIPLLLPRVGLILTRGRAAIARARHRAAATALALAMLPVNDILYAGAVVVGAVRYAALRRV